MKSRMRVLVLGIIFSAVLSILTGGMVFAEGGGLVLKDNTPIGSGSSGNGSDCKSDFNNYKYRIDCAGTSWIFYRATSAARGKTVQFAPYKYLLNNTSKKVEIPSDCATAGGFWHYGVNVRARDDDSFGGSGGNYSNAYSTSWKNWGHWVTIPYGVYSYATEDVPGNRGNIAFPTAIDWGVGQIKHDLVGLDGTVYYEAEYYSLSVDNNSDVLEAYAKAQWYSEGNEGAPNQEYINSIMNNKNSLNGVYMFCAWESSSAGTPASNTYYTVSNVSNRTSTSGDGSSTDYSSSSSWEGSHSVATATIYLNIGEEARMTFSHDVHSKYVDDQPRAWTVYRNVNGSNTGFVNNSSYTISPLAKSRITTDGNGVDIYESSGESGKTTSGTAITNTARNPTFDAPYDYNASAANRPYTSAGANDPTNLEYRYVLRDYYTVSFKVAGTYLFCEKIVYVGGVTSESCSKFVVGDSSQPPVVEGNCQDIISSSSLSAYNNSRWNNGTTLVASGVHNDRLGGGWDSTVYAKPGDHISWFHCYYPGVQRVAYTSVVGVGSVPPGVGNHGEHGAVDTANDYSDFVDAYGWGWGNSFNVKNWNGQSIGGGSYSTGDSDVQSFLDSNGYNIKNSDVGGSKAESNTSSTPTRASVGTSNHTWECVIEEEEGDEEEDEEEEESEPPRCRHTNDYVIGSAGGSSATSSASVLVPYNFINTADVLSLPDYVYAGETAQVKGSITVSEKNNSETRAFYSTRVDDAEIRIISFTSQTDRSGDGAQEVSSINSYDSTAVSSGVTLNSNGTGETKTYERSVNVHDVSAGTYYCVAMAIFPADSGSDTNYTDKRGSNTWYVSSPRCTVVAKKPSLQVWGAGMYTSGMVVVENAAKRLVGNYYDYNNSSVTVFGSWVEQNIIANGKINIASGASTGKAGLTERTDKGLDGSHERTNDICIRSPLTMPNRNCTGGANNPGSVNSMNAPSDKAALIARFTSDDSGRNYVLHNECSLGSPSFDDSRTHVYKCDNNFEINGDIRYSDYVEATYSKLTDIPKIIIYAKRNINISCSVNRIDAVLIAEDNLNTCYNVSNKDSSSRSNQLQINGAVITNKMYANRTYGAATGTDSGVPAEIINYDTSLYLWGMPRADIGSSGKIETVYLTELAPRY